jgi:hypothetical protein
VQCPQEAEIGRFDMGLKGGLGHFQADEIVGNQGPPDFLPDACRLLATLDIFWLKDDSLDNLDELPAPDVLQQEIIDHLEAALAAFRDVAAGLPSFPAKD